MASQNEVAAIQAILKDAVVSSLNEQRERVSTELKQE